MMYREYFQCHNLHLSPHESAWNDAPESIAIMFNAWLVSGAPVDKQQNYYTMIRHRYKLCTVS